MTKQLLSIATVVFIALALQPASLLFAESSTVTKVVVTVDRGQDVGQCFGSLFEAKTSDGSLVIGAGFQNAYNTRYRADRHAIQFFIRPTDGRREMGVEELPRPTDTLTGSYLFAKDGTVYSTYGGLKSWNEETSSWRSVAGQGGTHETMRVGSGTLAFGDSRVSWNGREILSPPPEGCYQLFYYANGHLCFYYVNRKDKPYRAYTDDEDGFSRLYACPWSPGQESVDLSKAISLRLPIVGETTFAWGQFGDQIVTGSNIGGFYVFNGDEWRMLLEPKLGVSYQLYSSLAFYDQLLMGQYPTGRVFSYDGKTISDQNGWPPVLEGVSGRSREAQTTAIYGGDLMVGVWPWGEVWRYNKDDTSWSFAHRMFTHPELSSDIVHPYDVENRDNSPQNLWGQRVTSLVPNGSDLFISTSAKAPFEWAPERYPFLAQAKWKSYGKVYRATMPGHLTASTKWTDGPTTFAFTFDDQQMSIRQDGAALATSSTSGLGIDQALTSVSVQDIQWGDGVYGPHKGVSLSGRMSNK